MPFENQSLEVAMVPITALLNHSNISGVGMDGPVFFSCLEKLKEQLDSFEHSAGRIWHCTISPGEFLHVPLGFMLVERTLGDDTNVAFRTCSLPYPPPPAEGSGVKETLTSLMLAYSTIQGRDYAIYQFWETICELWRGAVPATATVTGAAAHK